MFPYGRPGWGLLILRLEVAASLHLDQSGHLALNPHVLACVGLIALSLLLIAGLLTPLAATACGIAEIVLLFSHGGGLSPGAILGMVNSIPLLLLGPGAYSLDARLFGRRVLILHSKDPPPHGR